MEIPKPVKVIAILFIGLVVLTVLAGFATSLFITAKTSTVSEVQDSKDFDEGVSQEPSRGNVDGKDAMYIYPGYNSGGDGSKLVKNASIAMEVKDIPKTLEEIKSYATNAKGFVQALSDSGTDNDRSTSITIRVPSSEFDNVVNKVKSLAVEVTSTSEGSDDVSGTYQDLQTRLKTQKALEKQLLQLLDKAENVDDILSLQRELANVRMTIETYELELKNYDQQVNMSTIYIKVSKASEALDVTGDVWKPLGVFKEALTSLVDFAKGIVNVTIWAVVFSPIILIPAGIVWLVTRKKK